MYTLAQLLIKRRYTCVTPILHQSREAQILDLCRSGSLFEAINLVNSSDLKDLESSKSFLYASLLQTSTKVRSVSHGLQIHSHLVKSGLELDRLVGNSLLSFYFKLGPHIDDASRVFQGLSIRDVISWTSMMSAFIRAGRPRKAIQLFLEMLNCGILPNPFTLSSAIKGCSQLDDVVLGGCFHGVSFTAGFQSNCYIASALIDMYGKNGRLEDARKVFDELLQPDSVCWTTVISVLTWNDSYGEALGVFYLMQRESELVVDEFTYGSVLTACGNIRYSKQGKQIHGKLTVQGLGGDIIVESSLIDMYAKCGMIEDARRVFDKMARKNSVSWCALLGGYCHNGDLGSVLELFRVMDSKDLYSFGTVLRACAGMADVRLGKEVHCQYVRKGEKGNIVIESALVDLYAKSGYIEYAERVFREMKGKNLITWNSMICGFAQNGRGGEAVGLYSEMVEEGMKPDYITFVGLLFGCSHSGFVEQGRMYFRRMKEEYGIRPGGEHYNCMVDLLGRAGLIEEAESLIESRECEERCSLRAALLGACLTTGDCDAAERVARKMMEVDPHNHLSYVHLINAYKAVGRFTEASAIRKTMEHKCIHKTPGKSW